MNKKKRKKTLIILYYYHPYVSGVSVYAKRVAERLAECGHEVTVLTSRHEKHLPKKEMIKGVRVVRRPVLLKIGKGVLMPTFWLDAIVQSLKHDSVNPHLPLADIGLSSLFIPKKKLVTTYQCDINLGFKKLERFLTKTSLGLMRVALSRSSDIVVLSSDYFENSKMKKFQDKAIQVYPPIDAKDFKRIDSFALRKKLEIDDQTKIVGFVGRIVYEKGIQYLIESISFLKEKYPKLKIVIVGDHSKVAGGGVKDELDKYIKKYPGKIVFTGYLSDEELNQFYSMIDILVLPSIDPLEAFGMVQVEAMLCGSPVVASDLPGVREVVKRTGYGLLSKPKDAKDIAKKILDVLENPSKYHPEREKVIDIFDVNETIKRYEELLNK